MPQVPGLENQAPQFSTQVAGVQFPYRGEFGREGAAIENLGQSVESVARTGAQIYDEVQRQHDISTASKSYVDAEVDHSQQLQNLKISSPDGFVHDDDTGEVVKNANGSQRTISQEYWGWADQDYQTRQQGMSPRAAAMFREQMLPHIGDNTRILQSQQLELQKKSADNDIQESMARYGRSNDTSPYPEAMPYYQEQREDGSINLRGSTYKINSQLSTLKLWSMRQGPNGDNPGMYNSAETEKLSEERLSTHADGWVRSAVTDILENDTPRDHKNKISTTAVQQVLNLRDVIEGKDPQSMQTAQGMPTVNNSLTAKQADKWRNQLNTMLDGAKKIDASEWELHLQQMKSATSNGQYKNFDALVTSPEFQNLVHAAEPLGMTPEKQIREMSEIFGNAARTAGHAGVSDLQSDAIKRTQIDQNLKSFEMGFPQYAGMLGVKFTDDMGKAILGEAKKSAYAQLDEESKQFREDPAKFAAQLSSGANNQPRSPKMHAVEEQIFSDPSLFAALKPMSTGESVLSTAIKEMKKIGATGFGQGYEPNFLSKDDYKAWAKKIENAPNQAQVESMFQQMKKLAGPDAGSVMDQLTKVGELNPRYQTAWNSLPSSTARIDAFNDIASKGAASKLYAEAPNGENEAAQFKKAYKANIDSIDFVSRLYGGDSPEAAKATKGLTQTWVSAYSKAMLVNGTTQSQAQQAASESVRAQFPPISTVQKQHNFLGGDWFDSGPASKVQFSRADLSSDQQDTIRGNLLKSQQADTLSNYRLAPAPIKDGDYNFNKKLDTKWVSEHPFLWYPVRQGTPQAAYRMMYQGMNADGSPNGKGYDVRVLGSDGTPRYYEMNESQALKKPSIEMGPPAIQTPVKK